jgi:predicted amidohydrolase
MSLRVAACAYPIERLESFVAFAQKQEFLVERAVQEGARLLVFPEYASMELTSILPTEEQGDLQRELCALQALFADFLATYASLAEKHGIYILSPSFPERSQNADVFRNRIRLHAPNGEVGVSEKMQMTRFEREEWGIAPGECSRVFHTELGVIGVAICYDVEFPLLVRRQVEAGAEIILVPSCTDTLAGYHRVSLSCRARALENQCFVVQAPTVGGAAWSIAVDQNWGAAAVYGPVDRGFASDGVVAQGALDAPGWVFGDLDLAALARVRREGQVTNHRDWSLPGHLTGSLESVSL